MAKQTIEIKLYLSELMYDVQQKTFLIGDLIKTDENIEQATKMQEVVDEKKDIVLRSFGNSLASLKNDMSEYLVDNTRYADNLLMPETRKKIVHQLIIGYGGKPAIQEDETEDNTIFLMLRVPMNYNMAAKESVATALHDFMVNKALADWFSIYSPERVDYYSKMAETDLVSLRIALNKRIRKARVHTPSKEQPRQNETRYE